MNAFLLLIVGLVSGAAIMFTIMTIRTDRRKARRVKEVRPYDGQGYQPTDMGVLPVPPRASTGETSRISRVIRSKAGNQRKGK